MRLPGAENNVEGAAGAVRAGHRLAFCFAPHRRRRRAIVTAVKEKTRAMAPTLDWVLCLSLNILLTYIPHLALRVPAVHAKLAADQ